MAFFHSYSSPLGMICQTSDGSALTGLWFEEQRCAPSWQNSPPLPVFLQTDHWLDLYFAGHVPVSLPPLSLQTTPFRQAVYEILLQIPYGTTRTYGEVARELARRTGAAAMSAQAVGNAVGHNPIALIIPCHRVMGANGRLVGYAAGLARKQQLLTWEKLHSA